MKTEKKPLILISNDDGIASQGIRVLVESIKHLGDIVVVAPDKPQSAKGQAITISEPLYLSKYEGFGDDVTAYQCSGTPVDCVKIGRFKVIREILGRDKPDLVLSGINHGKNAGLAVLYSGTVSAAMEGAVNGAPSIGFSLFDDREEAHFDHIIKYVQKITAEVIKGGLPKNITLNVNFPLYIPNSEIKGIRISKQTKAQWKEDFVECETPNGVPYYWLTGDFENFDSDQESDEWAINNNYVAIVPCQYDFTDYKAIDWLKKSWRLEE